MATATAPLESAALEPTAPKAPRPHRVVWFELPVRNLSQAIAFYEQAFAAELKTDPRFPGLAMFPRGTPDSVTGAIVETGNGEPSTDGTVVYLNCDGDLDGILKRALASGATLLKEVAQLPEAWALSPNSATRTATALASTPPTELITTKRNLSS